MDIFRDAVRAVEAAAPRHPIGGLQALRARHKGLHRIAGSIFGNRAIDHGWIFHWGGREELQFNLGLDSFADGFAAFRAGAAFSFEPSRSLPDIEVLVPKVARFNAYLRENPESFADLAMWHWQDGVRSDDYPVVPIADRLIRRQTFVFLGERQPLDRIDPEKALRTLDRLYPLYRWVEGMEATASSPSGSSAAIGDPAADALAPGLGRTIDGGRWIRATTRERTLDIYLRHLEMQRRLADELRREGASSVVLEASLGNRSIDAVARFGEDLLFFEVKTARTARVSPRGDRPASGICSLARFDLPVAVGCRGRSAAGQRCADLSCCIECQVSGPDRLSVLAARAIAPSSSRRANTWPASVETSP